MTEAELLEAVRAASLPDGGEGHTVEEFAAALGWSPLRVRKTLRAGIAAGRYRVSRKRITDISGRQQWVPSYVPTE